MKLEYLKVIIRSTMGKYMGIKRSELEEEIKSLEISLNDIESLKQKVLKRKIDDLDKGNNGFESRLEKIEIARKSLANEISSSRNKLEDSKAFKAAATWYEYGERCNKFFLNLDKFRNKQKLIANIKNGDNRYNGQKEVMEGITEFYNDLYSKKQIPDVRDPSFFDLCPKLNESNKQKLEDEIGLEDV
jgi:hypothetical protein